MENTCCVCGKKASAVVNSGLGAWSAAYCAVCGNRGAEPLADLEMMLDCGCTVQDLADYLTWDGEDYVTFGWWQKHAKR